MNEDIQKKILSVLSMFPQVRIAIIYGSFANGTQKPMSDVDIGIAGLRKLEMDDLAHLQTQLSNATSKEIDLIDFNIASGTVFKEALTRGKIILNLDDELYARILSRMLFNEADYEPLRNRILEVQRKEVLG